MPYVTKTEVKKYHGITWTTGLDTFIDGLISAAEKYVEKITGRKFIAPDPDSDVTLRYNGNGSYRLPIDDLRSLTSLVVDGVALTVDEDFYLYPLNATADGEPFTAIELVQPSTRLNQNSRLQSASPYIFDEAQRNIVITGKWGYSATPPEDVKVAVIKVVGSFIKENIGDIDLKEVKSYTLGDFSATYSAVKDIAHALGVDQLLQEYVLPEKKGNVVLGTVIQVS